MTRDIWVGQAKLITKGRTLLHKDFATAVISTSGLKIC